MTRDDQNKDTHILEIPLLLPTLFKDTDAMDALLTSCSPQDITSVLSFLRKDPYYLDMLSHILTKIEELRISVDYNFPTEIADESGNKQAEIVFRSFTLEPAPAELPTWKRVLICGESPRYARELSDLYELQKRLIKSILPDAKEDELSPETVEKLLRDAKHFVFICSIRGNPKKLPTKQNK